MQIGSWRFLQREIIPSPAGEPYLVRYRLFECPRFGIYLHHILLSDDDRHLHCHPWSFISVLLWGSYDEVYFSTTSLYQTRLTPSGDKPIGITEQIHRRAPSACFRRAEHAHRLLLSKPCWTLVLRGPHRRAWGFYTESGWVDAKEYIQDKYSQGTMS